MDAHEIFFALCDFAGVDCKGTSTGWAKLKSKTNRRNKAILKKQRGGLKHLIDRCFRLTGDFMPVHVNKRAKDYCADNQLGDISILAGTDKQSLKTS